MTAPDLRLSLAQEMTPWWITALRRQSRVPLPWRCTHQQPPVVYSPPAQPLQRCGPSFLNRFFLGARRDQETCQPDKLQAYSFLAEGYTKESSQTLVFDPGGSTGRLRPPPILGTWRAWFFGELFVRTLVMAGAFFNRRSSEYHFFE